MARPRLTSALLLAFCLGAAAPAPAASVKGKKRELQELQRELEQARKEIDSYRRQEQSITRQLHRLESHDGEARKRLAELKGRIDRAEGRRSELRAQMGGLKLASGFWHAALTAELRDYAGALAAREDAYGSRGLWAEELRRAAIRDKARLLASLKGASQTAAKAEAQSLREARDLTSRRSRVAAESATSRKEIEAARAAAAEAQKKLEAAERRARELEESAKALTSLIDRLGRTQAAAPGPTPLQLARHSLSRPAAGAVLKPFGRELNRELNTWVIHQGVLFKTSADSPVTPVRAGKVIYAGPFRSYGKVVIVDHGAGLFSVYGELREILKAKGASVAEGEALARSTERLYLELRRGVEALDPMQWLTEE